MLRLTLTDQALAAVAGGPDESQAPRRAASDGKSPAEPASRAIEDIPLTVLATLVDMRIPLARLATLKPGMVLPVSVARSVPLSIAGTIVAHGTVGELDDRVALQITQAFPMQETQP